MPDPRLPAFAALLLALPGCMIRQQGAPPPAYSLASPYAASAAPVVSDAYCAESVGEAQDAAAQAAATGSGRDAGRAERTARYARRDCR